MTLEELGLPKNMQALIGRKLKEKVLPVESHIEGKSVLVTGAGGSIGSQLCVQLIAMKPRLLVMYEMTEFGLYQIDQQLRELKTATRIVAILGNLTSRRQIQSLLKTYKIDMVYHAAAYKHVPLVECNPIVAMENNLWSAKNLVDACRDCDVKEFTLVSTDKAVNPTNVMGATKRLAEFVTLCGDRPYKVVRFGNVLLSSGSVVPLFFRQLTQHLEVTITDAAVSRYFMSISEAVGLILQSCMVPGSICVLDMGEQIKIEAVARRLAGLLNEAIKIKYIGLRPGEKMYEELALGHNLKSTRHPCINVALEEVPSYEQLSAWLRQVKNHCDSGDLGGLRTLLQEIVPGYVPACGIVDSVWLENNVFTVPAAFDDCFAPASCN